MNCEVLQNRLLALPDLNGVPDDLRVHVDGCPACQTFLAGAKRLDELLARVPVPPTSEEAKAAFLDRVTQAGPVIGRIPVVPRGGDTGRRLRGFLDRVGGWKTVSGLAAAIMVGGVWWFASGPRGSTPSEVAGLRHELLNKEVKHLVALSGADTPPKRMVVWADVADDLRTETRSLYKVGQADEMDALARMFDKAVRQGILHQADLLDVHTMPAAERATLLRDVTARLADVEAEADRLAAQAPPQSVEPLKKIAAAARDGRLKLRGGA